MTLERYQVLIVDDDTSVLTSMAKVLEKKDFSVDTAETGKQAIEKLKTKQYDAVIVDLKLPDMDGIDVLSKAKSSNAVKIMLTGFPSLVSSVQATEEGVDCYLSKPVRPEELVALVQSKLRSKHSTIAH